MCNNHCDLSLPLQMATDAVAMTTERCLLEWRKCFRIGHHLPSLTVRVCPSACMSLCMFLSITSHHAFVSTHISISSPVRWRHHSPMCALIVSEMRDVVTSRPVISSISSAESTPPAPPPLSRPDPLSAQSQTSWGSRRPVTVRGEV